MDAVLIAGLGLRLWVCCVGLGSRRKILSVFNRYSL